jgi:hypothetical protein
MDVLCDGIFRYREENAPIDSVTNTGYSGTRKHLSLEPPEVIEQQPVNPLLKKAGPGFDIGSDQGRPRIGSQGTHQLLDAGRIETGIGIRKYDDVLAPIGKDVIDLVDLVAVIVETD